MNWRRSLLVALTAAGIAINLTACDRGPLEKAGRSIDKAGEKAGGKIKDAVN